MTYSILCLSTNSRSRRLYHRSTENVDCEWREASDIAEGLTLMMINRPDYVLLDSTIPVFEITVLIDLIKKKPEWKHITLVSIGFDENIHHIFPHNTLFTQDETQLQSLLEK